MRWEKADPISIKGTFFNVLRKYLPKAQSSKPESQKPKKKFKSKVSDAEKMMYYCRKSFH